MTRWLATSNGQKQNEDIITYERRNYEGSVEEDQQQQELSPGRASSAADSEGDGKVEDEKAGSAEPEARAATLLCDSLMLPVDANR